jgi:MFS family permease
VLGGFLFGAPWVLGTLAVVESMGIRRLGSVLGFLGLFSTIGMAIGPVVTGRIFDVTHSYHLAFLAFIALSVLSAAAVFACLPLEREQERFAAPTASAAA